MQWRLKKTENADFLYLPPPKTSSPDPSVTKPAANNDEMFYLLPPPKIQGFTPMSQQSRENVARILLFRPARCALCDLMHKLPLRNACTVVAVDSLIKSLPEYTSTQVYCGPGFTRWRQKLIRARVAAQGLTVVALVGGMFISAENDCWRTERYCWSDV